MGDGLDKAKDNRNQLPMRLSGFEDIGAAYQRIAAASVRVGMGTQTPEEKQLTLLEKQDDKLGQIVKNTADFKPAIKHS